MLCRLAGLRYRTSSFSVTYSSSASSLKNAIPYVKCAEVARSAAALIDKNLSYRKLVSVVVTPFKVIQSHRYQYQSKARMRLIPISE